MSLEASDHQRSPAVNVAVVRLMTARTNQRFHAVDTVVSMKTNSVTTVSIINSKQLAMIRTAAAATTTTTTTTGKHS